MKRSSRRSPSRTVSRSGAIDPVALRGEEHLGELEELGLVVHDQDARGPGTATTRSRAQAFLVEDPVPLRLILVGHDVCWYGRIMIEVKSLARM